jgi:dienelactone hydrolase
MTDSQPQGFLAAPPTGKGPGVLVLHAWWGLNDTMKAVCTQLAESGFVAFAPDLYHGKIADNIADAEALGKALDTNHLQAKADIAEATMFLNERAEQAGRGLAVVGFSLGAYYALDLAAADPEHIRSVVLFYGTGGGDSSNSRAAYLGHFAENDEFEPQSNIDSLEESLRRAGRPVTFYHYSGTGHWFFEPDRSQAYHQAAASLAWERTLTFLKRSSQDRMPPIPLDQMTELQRKSAEEIIQGPRGGLYGPFIPLLRSPELMDSAQRMGKYLRYKSAIGDKLSELVILIVARRWTQQVEWAIHGPIAIKAGISPEVVTAIADGRRPQGMMEDEEIVYDFCAELQASQSVSDATYHRAVTRFGEQGVIDLVGVDGYYTLLAMIMNTARTAVPDGEPGAVTVQPLKPFPK